MTVNFQPAESLPHINVTRRECAAAIDRQSRASRPDRRDRRRPRLWEAAARYVDVFRFSRAITIFIVRSPGLLRGQRRDDFFPFPCRLPIACDLYLRVRGGVR